MGGTPSSSSSHRLTYHLRFLNKGVIIGDGFDGRRSNKWTLRSIDKIDSQRLHGGSSTYDDPLPNSIHNSPLVLNNIPVITVSLSIIFYDRVAVHIFIRLTCVTLLRRIVVRFSFLFLSMVVAVVVEGVSRATHGAAGGIYVFWLTPYLVFVGIANAIGVIGQMNFFHEECPESMGTHSISMVYLSQAMALCFSIGLLEACDR
ncbi:protein NRT1/ PTR FAMILY 2.13-like [Impatiens glandulifera]|uniref:protein NRT1/ PTR FAMILY 2.13-like n=1 Tax=Impatiens glandulifera TaxID=253017 RepID=UPI001FB165A9|nr:protein NRT1/ PTR FAMILY 2.13-like [Impatiens glandulifera]